MPGRSPSPSRRSARSIALQQDAHTGHAGLDLLEFTDVDGFHAEPEVADDRGRSRRIGGQHDGVAEAEHVSAGLLARGMYSVARRLEDRLVDPAGNGDQRSVREGGDRRLQVQAARYFHGDNDATQRADDGRELIDGGRGGPRRQADEHMTADAQDIAAIEGAGRVDRGERQAERRDEWADRVDLAAAAVGSGPGENRLAIDDDQGILDKKTIGMFISLGSADQLHSVALQECEIGRVLSEREIDIHWLTVDVGHLALGDTRARMADDGSTADRHAPTLAQRAPHHGDISPVGGGYGTARMSTCRTTPVTGDRRAAGVGGWVLAGFPALAALAVDPGGYAPVGPAKYLVIAVLVPLALGLLVVGGRPMGVDRTTAWWWIGLLAWWVVTAFTGVDRFHSWVGIPERRLGVVAWLIFFVAYICGSSLGERERRRVVLGAVVAAAGVGLVALGEAFDISLLDLATTTSRLGGPFGSAAYLGAAGTLLVPLAAGVALDTMAHRVWRSVAAGASTVGVVAVAGSATRAAWVGLVVAGLVTLVVRRAAIQARPGTALTVAAIAATAFVIGGWFLPDTERASDATSRESGSGRLDEWRVAASVIADRPIVGAGLEGYRIVAGQHISADYERAYGRRVLPDRAHSGILDAGVAGGIPAMILLVGLWFTVGRRVWFVLRHGPTWMAGAAVGLIAYLAQQQFLFPLTEIDPMTWLIAGVVVAGAPSPRLARQMPRPAVLAPVVLALVALWFGVGNCWPIDIPNARSRH